MKSNLLTIAIPTYNRPHLLRLTLEELIKQCRVYNIPIVISDNSENDGTSSVVEYYQQSYKYIRYSKNPKNIGLDRNFLRVVDLAETEYVWIFGDDDLPIEDAIERIIVYLQKNKLTDFFIVNSAPYTADLTKSTSNSIVKTTFDITYKKCESALVDISWYTTFVGSFVFRRQTWQAVDPSKYLDTVFVHCGILFESMCKFDSITHFIGTPLIKYRTANASWSANTIKIFFVLWPTFIKALPSSIGQAARRQAVVNMVERFFTFQLVCALRAADKFNLRDATLCNQVLFENYGISIRYLVFTSKIFFVAITPTSMMRCLQKMYRLIPKNV